MLYRKLGNTGYDVGVIGFGTWQLGGRRWKDISQAGSIDLLHKSLDLGINLYDVAVVYGQYKDSQGYLQSQSQERLGKAFQDRRERVIYCVKLGQFDEYTHRHNYDPKRIVEQFNHSLRRLKTDFIDIALIHAPSLQAITDSRAISVLQTLQALGRVRAIGYAFEAEPEHVIAALQQPIDVIMLQCNLIDQGCVDAIESARKHGVGVLVGGPFKRGYLTGKYSSLIELPEEDEYWKWNLNLSPQKVDNIIVKVNELLNKFGSPRNLRYASLEFLYQQLGVNSCVVGHRSLEEVIENINIIDEIVSQKHFLNTLLPIISESNQVSVPV